MPFSGLLRILSPAILLLAGFLASPVHAQSLGDAVDAPTLTWTTGGSANWFGQTAVSMQGGDAAQSGDIANSQSSYLETTVAGPGTLIFRWKVSSEPTFDNLRFLIDWAEQQVISGEQDWAERSYSFDTAGTRTLRWEYVKDSGDSTGQDAGWLDSVVWQPNTYTLTVNSTRTSGVAIAASPSAYAGTTNYTKTAIPQGTNITLTAPAISGDLVFIGWFGCDTSSGTACTVTMNAAKTVTANYGYYIDNGDGTVTDIRTGLIWMRCALGQTWSPEGQTCKGTATTYTYDEATALTHSFAGQNDWRLPKIRELASIVDYSRSYPAVDPVAFPATPSSHLLSGSPGAYGSNYAWLVYFDYGNASNDLRGYSNHVRLVRGGQSSALLNDARPDADYRDNGDGTVTHLPSGLIWMRCALGQTWTGSTCSGTASIYSFDQAATLTHSFAGQSDWRTPSISELQSLPDYTRSDPAINPGMFPDTPSSHFWSGSPRADDSYSAWGVYFGDGNAGGNNRYGANHVRLVRGGQSFALYGLSVNKQGGGTVTSNPAGINCGSRCAAFFANGETVNLYASPEAGNVFLGWSGACAGNGTVCTVTMNASRSVTANFTIIPGAPTITRLTAGNGSMRVEFSPPANAGAAGITGYTATCTGNGVTHTATGAASPLVVSGLTNGVSYTCTVSATNSAGTGASSAEAAKVVRPASIAPLLNILLD